MGRWGLRFGRTVSRAVRDTMQMKKRTRVNSHSESSRELFAEDKFSVPRILENKSDPLPFDNQSFYFGIEYYFISLVLTSVS